MITVVPGTFIPVAGCDGWWEVCTGGGTYVVNEHTGECSCPAWEHRCSGKPGLLCKHGVALGEHLDRERECPLCAGRGVLIPRLLYVGTDGKPDTRPLPCAACGGSGLKDPPNV